MPGQFFFILFTRSLSLRTTHKNKIVSSDVDYLHLWTSMARRHKTSVCSIIHVKNKKVYVNL